MNGKPNYGYAIGAVLGGLLSLAIGLTWLHFMPEPVVVGATVDAKPAPEVARETTTPLAVDFVKVFPPAVKAKLKLPAAVVADPNANVVASSKVAGDEHPHTITTVLDTSTGKFDTYDRTDPLPWLAPNTRSEVAIYYGLKNTVQTIRLAGRQEFLQIKALHLEATASVDLGTGKPDTFIGIGGRFSF